MQLRSSWILLFSGQVPSLHHNKGEAEAEAAVSVALPVAAVDHYSMHPTRPLESATLQKHTVDTVDAYIGNIGVGDRCSSLPLFCKSTVIEFCNLSHFVKSAFIRTRVKMNIGT